MPLAKVEPVSWKAPSTPFDGLLIGSANAIRHAGAELDKVRHLPVHAVGETTARAAREAGLAVETVGQGGLQAVIETFGEREQSLLRLAGETHLTLETPAHVRITTEIVYRAKFLSLSSQQAGLLVAGSVVILHSGEMARHFAEECERLALDRSGLVLAAMAPRIAQMAGKGWESVHIATARSDAAVLDLAAELCNR
ncbi:uroporphyrinogen-III synthase [Parerythrobacter aestuarii]|uniref:uroporphyrinogen-III synthase n=1 Tax=Parerythrobacter aestuarii TaxID=3020909 RepID=UPI0024DE2829|nr:uroporphyrinogen-III synthase [Parerythrobacter aestuarii]